MMDLIDALNRLQSGFSDAYGEGREDNRIAYKRAREDAGKNPEPPRINISLGTNRTLTMLRQLMGTQPQENPTLIDRAFKAEPELAEVHRQMGMGLSKDPVTRAGQILGHIGADLTQDRSRELWWLLTAPQAVGNVSQEAALHKFVPELYEADARNDERGNPVTMKNQKTARRLGLVNSKGKTMKGVISYL